VNQVMGDGIMALFGAPLAHEDHAVRACYAALRMQEGVRRYADELRRAQGVEVQIRVGLNSGDVVVRSIGSDPLGDGPASDKGLFRQQPLYPA
jgi:class 3 adenylate cyclase